MVIERMPDRLPAKVFLDTVSTLYLTKRHHHQAAYYHESYVRGLERELARVSALLEKIDE